MTRALLSFLVTLAFAACGPAQSLTPDAGKDAGTLAETDAGTPVACYEGANLATLVHATKVTAALPAATGGTITDGTWLQTSITYYAQTAAGPDSDQSQRMVIVSGTTLHWVRDPTRIAGTFTTSGTNLVLTSSGTCPSGPPAGMPNTLPYSANATQLQLFDGTDRISTYSRQ